MSRIIVAGCLGGSTCASRRRGGRHPSSRAIVAGAPGAHREDEASTVPSSPRGGHDDPLARGSACTLSADCCSSNLLRCNNDSYRYRNAKSRTLVFLDQERIALSGIETDLGEHGGFQLRRCGRAEVISFSVSRYEIIDLTCSRLRETKHLI